MGAPPAWRLAAASVRGGAHQASGLPCQDAHAWRVLPDGTLLAAVADGAGSAARADEGAGLAASAGLEALAALLAPGPPGTAAAWRQLLEAAMAGAREAVLALAAASGAPARAFATTLTCAVVAEGWLALAHNGDGAAVAAGPDGELRLVARPARGEYANEVAFLTGEDGLGAVTYTLEAAPVAGLALLTDGLLRLALDLASGRPHGPFFEPLLAFARESGSPEAAGEALAAFLASDRVSARTDDDTTLLLAVRAPGAAAGEGGDGAAAGEGGGGEAAGEGGDRGAVAAAPV